jgi:hypothetical protein
MKSITLTKGKVAWVDDEDYEWLNQWKWHANVHGLTWYAVRGVGPSSSQLNIKMHRLIMNAPEDMEVDHINGNGWDNRRENLRLCTNLQNQWNRPKQRNNTTGYKGVKRSRGKFRATIQFRKKDIHLGHFSTAEQAARAYDKKARELFGEFARLNFPD